MSAGKKTFCAKCSQAVRVYVPKGDAADRFVMANHRDKTGDYCPAGRSPVRVFLKPAPDRKDEKEG